MFDLLVFIGRFQPFHSGHLACVETGLAESRHLLILAGSAARPRSLRHPFNVAEREQMIRTTLTPEQGERISIAPLTDTTYNDAQWMRQVQAAVFATARQQYPDTPLAELKIGLVGHSKDKTSYYLKLFPTWGEVEVRNAQGLNASALRVHYFGQPFETSAGLIAASVPQAVLKWLQRFAGTPEHAELCAEYGFIADYQRQFANYKYPPTFTTVDSLVLQSGHLLLVRRGARPGKGLLALPGGFVDQSETLLDACLRELREETRLKVPEAVLRGSVTARETFDDPHRSSRGRTFTTAFRIDLRADTALPRVRGGDDAKDALWVPLAEIHSEEMFEDHYAIIQKLVGI